MRVIAARNVHSALPAGLALLAQVGQSKPSRVGSCITAPYPVSTVYERPCERVLFWPERDGNPFFHFFESLHFLAGRSDVAFLKRFIRDYGRFSDDGKTLTGAYGYRWRRHFGFDQLDRLVALLRAHPDTRRGVLAMWDPQCDLREDESGADLPCNVSVMFGSSYGKRDEPNRLNMTVINRSNDIIFGLYGANAVHMSMLQEYVAAKLGLVVGSMTTMSNNFHAYSDVYARVRSGALLEHPVAPSPYETGEVAPYPMVQNPATWDRDLLLFMEDPHSYGYINNFFTRVAKPMHFAHEAYRAHLYPHAFEIIEQCQAQDWKKACREWLLRRQEAAGRKFGKGEEQ